LLKTWLAANYIMAPSGPYGYMGDTSLTVQARTAPSGVSSLNLFAGEGVYSITNSSGDIPATGTETYIKYAGLDKSDSDHPSLSDDGIVAGGALLTFNANTDKSDTTGESGVTTGVAANVAMAFGDQLVNAMPPGPIAIDAEDMLRMNGHDGWDPLPIPPDAGRR